MDYKQLKLDFTLNELTLSGQTEDVDVPGNSSTVDLRPNRLVCVEYPAVITSVDKMMETLGGEQTMSSVSRPELGSTAESRSSGFQSKTPITAVI